MSPPLDASIVTAFIHTTQALQFSKGALSLMKPSPIDPTRLELYENAVNNLTAAFNTIRTLLTIHTIAL